MAARLRHLRAAAARDRAGRAAAVSRRLDQPARKRRLVKARLRHAALAGGGCASPGFREDR
jgi:hypothetical protein